MRSKPASRLIHECSLRSKLAKTNKKGGVPNEVQGDGKIFQKLISGGIFIRHQGVHVNYSAKMNMRNFLSCRAKNVISIIYLICSPNMLAFFAITERRHGIGVRGQ